MVAIKQHVYLIIFCIVAEVILATGIYLFAVKHTSIKPVVKTNGDNCYYSTFVTSEIGKDTCIQFYVNNVVKSKNGNYFLNENQDYKKGFSVTIFANNLDNFSLSPQFYQYRTIEAVGVIKLYEGHPEMIISDASMIHILK